MPSQVWGRDAQEAHDNPYEYQIQEQFVREANSILSKLNDLFQAYTMKFHKNDRTIKKAVWMLQLDALDSLRDSLFCLENKRHRVTVKLFRDVVEAMDLASFFYQNTTITNKGLRKWYRNKVVPNKEYKKYIETNVSLELANKKRNYYRDLSKFTHRTYGALLDGYGIGRGDMMWHDQCAEDNFMVLPQTISYYNAVLASLIIKYEEEIIECQLFTKKEIMDILKSSLEKESAKRQFVKRTKA